MSFQRQELWLQATRITFNFNTEPATYNFSVVWLESNVTHT